MRIFMKKFISYLLFASLCFNVWADIPSGYYTSLNGKMGGAALKTAVYNIICKHTSVSSYSDLPKYFQKTDV